MIDISKLIEILVSILGVMTIYEIGYTMHFEHLKAEYAKVDFPNGKPHYRFHFWRVALFENSIIEKESNFMGLCFPLLKHEEHWIRVIGPLWWRTCTHEFDGIMFKTIDPSKVERHNLDKDNEK